MKHSPETSACHTDTAAVGTAAARGRRAEKIGIVSSDKMQKTVVVRVDRLVKHRPANGTCAAAQFMAHNEIEGVSIGDSPHCRNPPLSAHKRWRVVEVVKRQANRVRN
ncbi:MAG: 30S ribosomal protein S17 [Blastocatellia bacterium]